MKGGRRAWEENIIRPLNGDREQDPGITSKGKYVRGEEQSLLWAVEVMSTGFMPGPLRQAKDVERVWRLPCKKCAEH